MFTLNNVTLRHLEITDIDLIYAWESDLALCYYAGWISNLSRRAIQKHWEDWINDPPNNLINLGIEVSGRLVGYIQLGRIDREERHAEIGILIGDKSGWGQGIGSTAVQILCDFAFTVKNLERVFAETYAFNTRAQHMFQRAGFTHEGILRKHEFHNGVLQDMYVYGMLREEFYQRFSSIFHG